MGFNITADCRDEKTAQEFFSELRELNIRLPSGRRIFWNFRLEGKFVTVSVLAPTEVKNEVLALLNKPKWGFRKITAVPE